MKSILIAYLLANGVSTFQLVVYNEIHAELAEDCALEVEKTESIDGEACRRYFDFRGSSDDLRAINQQSLPHAELTQAQREEALYFIERGNRAMRYIVHNAKDLHQ